MCEALKRGEGQGPCTVSFLLLCACLVDDVQGLGFVRSLDLICEIYKSYSPYGHVNGFPQNELIPNLPAVWDVLRTNIRSLTDMEGTTIVSTNAPAPKASKALSCLCCPDGLSSNQHNYQKAQ